MPTVSTAPPDPLELLSRSVTQAGDVIAGVADGQREMRTPCHEWDVSHLVDHITQSARNGKIRAAGGKPDWTATPPHADDPVAEFRSVGAALVDAWSGADLDGTMEVPGMGEVPRSTPVSQITAELAVHTWDLARATGQSTALDAQVGEAALAWARTMLKPDLRGHAFAPEVSIDPAAPLYDRVAAFFGRDPNRV